MVTKLLMVIILKCIKPLCCVTGTNILFQVNYTSETNKLMEKENRLVVGRGEELGEGELDEGDQKIKTSNNKINMYQGYNVQHEKYNQHCSKLYIKVKRTNSENSHHREKFVFLSLILYLHKMMDVHQTYCGNHFMMYEMK